MCSSDLASIRALRASKSSEVLATTRDAVPKILRALAAGRHVGMVVDQHFGNGADITFFGRPCKANATLARLARRIDCPIYGSRVIRLPGYRFRIEAVRFDAARDADGRIDVAATTQKINDVVESWVREFPDQWLWLHRRWR